MKLPVIGAVLFSLSATSTYAVPVGAKSPTEPQSGIIYGPGYAFAMAAPIGWVLDTNAAANDGLPAVFYPNGSSWHDAKVVMYAVRVPKNQRHPQTIQHVIAKDIKDLKIESPALVAISAKSLPTRDEHEAIVEYFSGTTGGNYEAAAYMDEKHAVTELVMSARTKAGFDATMPKFRQLVGSYFLLSNSVQVGHSRTKRKP